MSRSQYVIVQALDMDLQEVPGQQGYIYSNNIATQLQCNGRTTTLKCALLIWTAGKHCYKNEQWTSTGTQTQPSRLTAGLVDTHTLKRLQQSMYTKNTIHYGVPHPTYLLQKNTCFQALEWSPWTRSHFIFVRLFTFFLCTVMYCHHHITRSTSRDTYMLLYFYPAFKKYACTVTPCT